MFNTCYELYSTKCICWLMYRCVKEFWKYFALIDAIMFVCETCTAVTSLCINRV